MAELDIDNDFTFQTKTSSTSPAARVAARMLSEAEGWLRKIYGDDHVNWHEICLTVKAKAIAHLNGIDQPDLLAPCEIREMAKTFTAQTMLEFEL